MPALPKGARAFVTEHRDLCIAAALGFAFLALYAMTLCRTVYWYDSAEFVAVSATLGIPHPPGYPLYTLIGHVFTWLPLDTAVAVNLMSAVFAAAAVALVYALARQLATSIIGAVIAATSLGCSGLFWMNAVIAEAYCPGLAAGMLTLLILLRGRRRCPRLTCFMAALVAGLGLGLHLSIATLGLGYALLVWGGDVADGGTSALRALTTSLKSRVSCLAAALLGTCAGASIFAYIPLRARMNPEISVGAPASWDRFAWTITGGNYKQFFGDAPVWTERVKAVAAIFYDQFLLIGMLLAVGGAVHLVRRQTVVGMALLLGFAGNVVFFFGYRVHDFEVFFLPGIAIVGLFIGAGVDLVRELIGRAVREEKRAGVQGLAAAAMALVPLSLLLANYQQADMSDFDETDAYIASITEVLPKNSIMVNFTYPDEWKYDAVFGMYVQRTLMQRRDVRIYNPTLEDLYKWLEQGRPVFAYYPVRRLTSTFYMLPVGPVLQLIGPRYSLPKHPGEPARALPPPTVHPTPEASQSSEQTPGSPQNR